MSVGDSLYLHAWQEPPIRSDSNLPLGQEKRLLGVVRLKTVYPAFSIAEPAEQSVLQEIQPGDLLYTQ